MGRYVQLQLNTQMKRCTKCTDEPSLSEGLVEYLHLKQTCVAWQGCCTAKYICCLLPPARRNHSLDPSPLAVWEDGVEVREPEKMD